MIRSGAELIGWLVLGHLTQRNRNIIFPQRHTAGCSICWWLRTTLSGASIWFYLCYNHPLSLSAHCVKIRDSQPCSINLWSRRAIAVSLWPHLTRLLHVCTVPSGSEGRDVWSREGPSGTPASPYLSLHQLQMVTKLVLLCNKILPG